LLVEIRGRPVVRKADNDVQGAARVAKEGREDKLCIQKLPTLLRGPKVEDSLLEQ
jgi:hypothetical protein